MSEDEYQQYRQAFEEFTEKFDVPTADMLEIVAGGGNGVEYVDLPGLLERAAKELREKSAEIPRLRKLVKTAYIEGWTDNMTPSKDAKLTERVREYDWETSKACDALGKADHEQLP